MGLEESGKLSGLVRDPSGKAEFIDAAGVKWDAKAFNSNFPAREGGYALDKSMELVKRELDEGENVILITENLTPAAAAELRESVSRAGWDDRILYWP